MKTGKTRRSRIIRLVLLMAILVASLTISFETSGKLQSVNATVSSSAPFQYIVTILMENNGLCDVTPSLFSSCGHASNPAQYITSLAQSYGFNTHYTGVGHPSEPNYVALLGGSTFGYTSDGYCCFQLNSPNLVDRLEAAGLSWKAFAEDSSGSATCSFTPPRSGDHYPFIDFSDMKTSTRCGNMLTTKSHLDPEFLAAINGVTLPNYVWLTPNDASATPMTEFFGTSPPPTFSSSFTYSPSSPQTGQTVSFTGSASGGTSPYSYSWSFGDGSTGTGLSAKHAYSSAGTLAVALTVKDNGSPQQTTTSQQSITVSGVPPPLTASFAYSPSSTQAGQPVTFTAGASGGTSPFTFSWDFGDGLTGTGSPVTHTYSSAGSYTAALAIKDSSSPQQTATSQNTVAVTSPPPPISASFTLNPSSPDVGQSISFTASASGGTRPYSYSWNYGDGSTGTGLQSTHIYPSVGTYQVTLTVADSQGNTATGVEPLVVGTSPLLDGFTHSRTSAQPGENINFTASARGGTPPYSYSWDFGNGASATGASATYSYATAGPYTVTLTVTDSTNHSNSTSQNLTIYSPAQPDFELNTNQSTLSAQPGSEQSLAITVKDIAGPSGIIRFNATISPSGPQISLDPANVTLTSEGSGSTSLSIGVSSTTAPGPYWIQVNATNGSITHSITVQVDVAQYTQVPTTGPPCRFCLGSAAIIGVLGLVGAVTLVTVQALRRRRIAEARNSGKKEGPIRASRCLERLLR